MFAILTASLIFLSSMNNLVLWVGFQLNQPQLEQRFCENKIRPEKKCHGKCYLKKQLIATATENDGRSSPVSKLEEAFKINFFCQQLGVVKLLEQIGILPLTNAACPLIHSRLFGKSIFHPPDCQALG